MSQIYSSIESIQVMLDGYYTTNDIQQALADLEVIRMRGAASESAYKNMKILLESKL